MGFFGFWDRQLSPGEILLQWRQFTQPSRVWDTDGALMYGFPGAHGETAFIDQSGHGNHGIGTGVKMSGDSPPFIVAA